MRHEQHPPENLRSDFEVGSRLGPDPGSLLHPGHQDVSPGQGCWLYHQLWPNIISLVHIEYFFLIKSQMCEREKIYPKICSSRSFSQKRRGLSWLIPYKIIVCVICFVLMSYGLLACIHFHIYILEIVI